MDLPNLDDVPAFNWLYVFARPKPDVPRAQTIAELVLLQQQFNQVRAQRTSSEDTRRNVLREQLQVMAASRGITQLADNYRQPMVLLMFAVAVVLLISCLNLSMLALARTTRRTKEIAIRLAVGARASQVIRYLIVESFVLAIAGSAVGTVVGQKALTFAAAVIPPALRGFQFFSIRRSTIGRWFFQLA
jgi:ABC-type antimicrobial peptide transport system permease subunit